MFGDLLFLLRFLLLSCHPELRRVTCCYSTFLFHYYYVTPTSVGWHITMLRFFFTYYYYKMCITPTAVGWQIAILCFFFTIIILILLPHIFVRSISRRCLHQTLWNLVLLRVDFFKMAAVAMETAMRKNKKALKWS